MTKSAKRKKEKNADFTKRKLKLGKGKQPASNAIDTSFKARSIALPQQSIAANKETSAPTTKRKLTLDALLTHLKHYGAGVRRDALQGLQELLGEHHDLIEPNLSRLVNGCVRLINDEDMSVRRTLHSFFAWLLPRIPREHLIPYASTLLLFTASAQSHIFPEIRLDAIRVLDLLLELIPEQVIAGIWRDGPTSNQADHGRKILDGYLGLLNVGTRFSEGDDGSNTQSSGAGVQSTTVSLSSTAKSIVLRSFSKFLYHATTSRQQSRAQSGQGHPSTESIPLWYLSGTFNSQEAFASFVDILSLRRSSRLSHRPVHGWSEPDHEDFVGLYPLFDNLDDQGTLRNIPNLEDILAEIDRLGHDDKSSNGLDVSISQLLVSLCRTVHPVLISTFLDVAPSVFSPSQPCSESDLDLALSLMEISRCLYGHLLRDTQTAPNHKLAARNELASIVAHMSPYFPFGENRMVEPGMATESAFQQMSLIYCEMFSLQSLDWASISDNAEETQGPLTKKRKLNHPNLRNDSSIVKSNAAVAKQTERVREYVVRCLRGSAAPGVGASQHPLGKSLTAQTYIALLPTVWWLLGFENDEQCNSEILESVLHHATKCGSLSAVKLPATEVVARLILLQSEPSYKGSFKLGPFMSQDAQKPVQDWLCHLPKVLWELNDKNAAASELILLFILRSTQRRTWLNNNDETSIILCTRLAPFFTIQRATRGELRGPFLRLDKSPVESEAFPTDPKNGEKRFAEARLKKLALDVAAILTSQNCPNFRGVRQKSVSQQVSRPENDVNTTKGDADPAAKSPLSLAQAQAALRRAVEKAVSGTTEEKYWYGVSHI